MGLNFRKSIKIAPGVRVNISKKGVSSVSVGGKGARVNVGKKGTRTTVGLPGTGLSYTTQSPYKKSKKFDKEPNYLLSQEQTSKGQRSILMSILLWIGILAFPFLFAWFTLQKKYTNIERVLAFGWLLLVVFGMISK
ncbi:DUF4236 domain-containing protein [Acinetobacter baumannii]|nr:DUF4236 domain-containing protein [Acinetobacter baumannii]PSE95846.1 DUF4236 domain-containing protein [Acinetobacter nosocomialis]MCT9373730.1 DUF4236 domain-containing protein [Acinetobacter baumannii]MDA3524075.1 DUF4236 domain-containing protein [Acinetobacter baumannii]MDA3529648.1 DUF4236 domain-containing protein [Acinetobacter baumannii]MDA4864862.1 DUF4236 domain-containing protein [Acinetobacter baumannii]